MEDHVEQDEQPTLLWDLGTAYDLFFSLHVLNHPEDFGLRGSWAAGVRSRISSDERKIFEEVDPILHVPLDWIHALPSPKDSATALWNLGQIPVIERLTALSLGAETPAEVREVQSNVAARGTWNEMDQEALKEAFQCKEKPPRPKALKMMLDWWSRPEEFGERYLAALQSYHQVFFAEEEARILPALKESLAQAQEMAKDMAVPALLEELSQGVRFSFLEEVSELVLTPSYWISPFVLYTKVSDQRMVLLFGGRPPDASLVPGEVVPDALLLALKALADPTRMRIMRYLAAESHNPAQLSRLLRLRAPTVIHHLKALRLAGLVHLSLEPGGEKRYAARTEMVRGTFDNLQDFLEETPKE